MEECDLKSSDFYEDKDGMLYIKNVSDKVIENVTKHVKKEIAFDFKTPGSVESKIENCKNVISDLIFETTSKTIDGYDRYFFKDKRNNDSFVLVPLTKTYGGQFESLNHADFFKINQNKLFKNSIRDVRHKALYNVRGEALDIDREKPLYAFSSKGIAQLFPEIMQSPIAYNERTGHFEFAADLGPSSKLNSESPRPVSMFSPVLHGTGLDVPDMSQVNRRLLSTEEKRIRNLSNISNASIDSALSSASQSSSDFADSGKGDSLSDEGEFSRSSSPYASSVSGVSTKSRSSSCSTIIEIEVTISPQHFSRIAPRSSGRYADKIAQQRQEDEGVEVERH